jgi:DNA primase
MSKRFTDEQLRQLRNEVPIASLLARLRWPHKRRDGRLVFVCPRCGESRSDLNPQENLVRCFACETNFNPIDFTIAARRCDFVEAVAYLLPFVESDSGE